MERTPLRAACESVSTGDAGMFLMPRGEVSLWLSGSRGEC